jgi:hypothetical protein
MTESVQWCSLFCTGNEAIGELSIRFTGDEWIDVPVCQECVDQIETNQQEALDRILGPVVDSDS